MKNLLIIAGGIGDLVTIHCLLCMPKAFHIFHPSVPADPEGMGR